MRKAAACSVLLTLGAHLGWNIHARRNLAREVEAVRRSGDPASLAELFPAPTVPDADNAALDLRAAYRAMSLTDAPHEAWKRLAVLEPPYRDDLRLAPPLSEDQLGCVRELVRVERRALRCVDEAYRKPALQWPTQAILNLNCDDVWQQRRVADLLRVAALHAHAQGERGEAIRRVRELLFIVAAVETLPAETAHLTALEISDRACELLAQFAQDSEGLGPTEDASALVALLLDEASLRAGWRRAVCARRAQYLDVFDGLAEGRVSSEWIDVPRPPWCVLRHVFKPMLRNDAALLCRLSGQVLDASQEPTWPGFERRQPQAAQAVRRRFPLHLFASVVGCDESRRAILHYWGLARRRMAAVALAVRSYAVDHGGRRPTSLAELVPAYLPNVPRDPFASGNRPLGYVGDGSRPIVYSVGANGTDEGGSDLRTPHLAAGNLGAPKDAVLYLDARPAGEAPREVWPYAPWPQ